VKHFTITSTADSLVIKRNLAGILHLRRTLLVLLLMVSATIAFLVNRQIMHLDSKIAKFLIIFGICFAAGIIVFYRDFFGNVFAIRKSGENFIINNRRQLNKDSIEYILEEGYSTKEHIEGYKKIRIKTNTGVITIGEGINPADRKLITDALLSFFGMDETSLRSLVW
jgi:hypothetical protein